MRRFLLWTVAGFCIGVPAHASLIITPYFDSSITSKPNATAIETLIDNALTAYRFTNDITVNIYFENATTGLGQSQTPFYTFPYTDFRSALSTEVATYHMPDQTTALNNLPASDPVPNVSSSDLALTPANARALGLCDASTCPGYTLTGPSGSVNIDGVVSVNFSDTSFDLGAVVQHEVDEVLGLGSGLNFPTTPTDYRDTYARPEDLYRFIDTFANGIQYSYSTTPGSQPYFSIDGGHTHLVNFNLGFGGTDYGDWQTSATPRIQDAVGKAGTTPTMGLEYTALNVIGYTAPEPATLGAGLLALITVALGRRRSMRQKV